MRRNGPRSLRFIAAEAAKQHLLHQLSALAAQHTQQKRVLQQQALLLQQQRHHQHHHKRVHAEHAQSPLHRTTSSSKRLAASSSECAVPASTTAAACGSVDQAQQQPPADAVCSVGSFTPHRRSSEATICSTSSITQPGKPPAHPDTLQPQLQVLASARQFDSEVQPAVDGVGLPGAIASFTSATTSATAAAAAACAAQTSFSSQICSAIAEQDPVNEQQQHLQEGGSPAGAARISSSNICSKPYISEIEIEELPTEEDAAVAAAAAAREEEEKEDLCFVHIVSSTGESPDALKSKAQQQEQQQQQQQLCERLQAEAVSLQVQLLAPGSLLAASCAGGRVSSSSGSSTPAAGSSRKSLMVASFCRTSQGGNRAGSPASSEQQHMHHPQQQQQQQQQVGYQQQQQSPAAFHFDRGGSTAGASSIACSMSSAGSTSSSRRPSCAGFAGFAQQQQQQQQQQHSAAGGSASLLFGANRQHIARMVHVRLLRSVLYSMHRDLYCMAVLYVLGLAGLCILVVVPQSIPASPTGWASESERILVTIVVAWHCQITCCCCCCCCCVLQEAHLNDAGSLSYHALTHHSRTGYMLAATSLAGALPGCVSDSLSHLYDSRSFIRSLSGMQHGGTAAAAAAAASGASQHGGCSRPSSRINSSRVLSGFLLPRAASGMSLDGRSAVGVAAAAGAAPSCSGSASLWEDICGVCLDRGNEVVLAGCRHQLCFDCARCIVSEGVGCRPPLCPFCRTCMTGFKLLDVTGAAAVVLEAALAVASSRVTC
jgi:hypothetical protein